ncbi:MAG: D-glycero-beta-D-manno-heptose-7-phosphate kinase [Fusobacterium sp.]|nr:D-glycero-beta-D-manno-heptose-7-phosphate kinase [Fusobacterium sp.]
MPKNKFIENIVENFKNIKIAVIGDLMLDEYVIGKVERISPEAPVPVVKVLEEKSVLGGAANVVNNLAHLGAKVICGGVIGNDANGEKLKKSFAENKNIDASLIVTSKKRPTIVKKRVLANHQQLLRLDWEEDFHIDKSEEENLIKNLEKNIKELNAVILSDYDKGLLTPSLSQKIIDLCRENSVVVTVDPKPKNINNFRGASSITPNKKEAYACVNKNFRENIDEVGMELKNKFNLETVLVTRSEEGMSLYEKEIHNIPTYAQEVYDVTGAGDTVISVFTLARAAGSSWEEAAKIANAAGGIVVGKIGTSTISTDELLETYKDIYCKEN